MDMEAWTPLPNAIGRVLVAKHSHGLCCALQCAQTTLPWRCTCQETHARHPLLAALGKADTQRMSELHQRLADARPVRVAHAV